MWPRLGNHSFNHSKINFVLWSTLKVIVSTIVVPALYLVIPGEGAARGKGTGIGFVKRTPIGGFYLILLTFIVFVLSFWHYETIKRYIFPG
jgi:hypothetical protein